MAKPVEARVVLQPVNVQINHTPGHAPICVPDPVNVSKGQHNEVVWTCPSHENFTVLMQSPSPFDQSVFTQNDNHSGEPILTPDTGQSLPFKYSVIVGTDRADPGVIINP